MHTNHDRSKARVAGKAGGPHWKARSMGLVLLLALLLLTLPVFSAACEEIDGGSVETTARGAADQGSDSDGERSTDTGVTAGGDGDAGAGSGSDADPPRSGAGSAALESPALTVARDVSPSVVTVFAVEQVRGLFGATQEAQGTGSGVIYSPDGYIVTNNHVIEGRFGEQVDEVTIRLITGEDLPAEVVGRDAEFDLAVLKVARDDLPEASFIEDIDEVQVGQYAIAIGSPLGESFNNSVTMGIVSGIGREIPAPARQQEALVDLIQTDAAISPGNSGGALADVHGRVIGINVAYIQPQSGAQDLGFAIPADVVVDVVEQLIETGQVQHAYLGIGSVSIEQVQGRFDLPVEEGVLVAEVYANTPADEAGLERGDVILELDGREVADQTDLYAALRRRHPGEEIAVTVVRDGDRLEIDVSLGERPTDFR